MPNSSLSFSEGLLRLLLLVDAADLLKFVPRSRSLVVVDSSSSSTGLAAHFLPFLLPRYYRPHPLRKVRDVLVAALGTQLPQGVVQAEQVRAVEPAGALGPVDVLGEGLDVLGPRELVVVRGADVYEGADGLRDSAVVVVVVGGGG